MAEIYFSRESGGGPGGISRAIVLVPGDGVVLIGSRDDVEIAVAVHVGDVHIDGAVRTGGDIGGSENYTVVIGDRKCAGRVTDAGVRGTRLFDVSAYGTN